MNIMKEKTISAEKLLQNKGSRYMETMMVNISSIVLLGGTGWLLDKGLGTKPLFFIIFFILSFPMSIYVLYKKYVKLAAKESVNKN